MATAERDRAAVRRTVDRRVVQEIYEENCATRKQEIARRLKLSERVLEQYFQSKQAEVEDEVDLSGVPAMPKPGAGREKRI